MLAARRSSRLARRCLAASASTAPHTVFALDFDGVLCDSVGESALAGWRAAERLWPQLFATPAARAERERVVEDMRRVRPVVETGYENVVQVRLLLEGVSAEAILGDWERLLPDAMTRWGLQRQAMVELFGRCGRAALRRFA